MAAFWRRKGRETKVFFVYKYKQLFIWTPEEREAIVRWERSETRALREEYNATIRQINGLFTELTPLPLLIIDPLPGEEDE
jgi:hypothetical protein